MVALKHISKRDARAIGAYEHLLLAKYPGRIKKLLLFGSKARGEARHNSDVDILVVVARKTRKLRREIAALTHEPIVRFGVDLSPVTIAEHELYKWSPFMANIKKDSVVLWTAPKRDT